MKLQYGRNGYGSPRSPGVGCYSWLLRREVRHRSNAMTGTLWIEVRGQLNDTGVGPL